MLEINKTKFLCLWSSQKGNLYPTFKNIVVELLNRYVNNMTDLSYKGQVGICQEKKGCFRRGKEKEM